MDEQKLKELLYHLIDRIERLEKAAGFVHIEENK